MQVHFLGTGCGRPTAHRFNSSTALELDGGRLVLLDCGAPCTALLKKQGLSPGDVTEIFVSHVHSDHVTGLPMLLREIIKCRKNGESEIVPEAGVDLYVPQAGNPELIEAVSILNGGGRAAGITEHIRVHSLNDGGQYRRDGFSVSAHTNRGDALESYGFLIEVDGYRLFYTGDLPGNFDRIEEHLNGLHLLITEAAHLKVEAYSILNSIEIGLIVVTHIRWIHHGKEDKLYSDLVQQMPERKMILAGEGMRLEIDGDMRVRGSHTGRI